MSLSKAVLAILDVFGEYRESDLLNLLTIAHEMEITDAEIGVLHWGVYGFYSNKMYEYLAELLRLVNPKGGGNVSDVLKSWMSRRRFGSLVEEWLKFIDTF